MKPKLAELIFACALIAVALSLFALRPTVTPRPLAYPESALPERATTSIPDKNPLPAPEVSATAPEQKPARPDVPDVPKKTVVTPGPLLANPPENVLIPTPLPIVGQHSDELNPSEIITLSNVERSKAGLAPLYYNNRLTAMAEAKAIDMIDKQYFAHESPSGVDVGGLAEKYGYEYLSVGENLALGDFASSSHVLNGWMNSPGHRANILKKDFTEIGVSAFQGTWEGGIVWFAVQEFGRPMSDCPAPDNFLKARITKEEAELDALTAKLDVLESEVASAEGRDAYNAKAKEYNTIVDEYNSLARRTKEDVSIYNTEVQLFNLCIAK